jgi:hypothetical protein
MSLAVITGDILDSYLVLLLLPLNASKIYATDSAPEVVLLLGQFCGLAKTHLISVHAAFRVSAWPKYAMSGVRLSRAVRGRSEL